MFLGLPGSRLYAYTGGKPFDPRLPCVVFIHGAQHLFAGLVQLFQHVFVSSCHLSSRCKYKEIFCEVF